MSDFKRFIKNLLLFGSPILLLVLSYFIFDPFQILYNYPTFPDNYAKSLNRDRISTQTFLNNNPTQKYSSFIFGSSRSSVFFTEDWAKYITDKNPYHFDASNEVISGIANKLKFIDKQGNKIDNALFILDSGTFEYETDTLGTIWVQDYRVSGLSPLKYHLIFFQSYFSNLFIVRYLDYKLFHSFRPYMNGFLENRKITYTPISNNFLFSSYEDSLHIDSVKYYARPLFHERPKEEITNHVVIKDYQLKFLEEIKEILEKHHTKFKVVIGPMYNQVKINKLDIEILEKYFGNGNIYDFSGVNEYTKNKYNYYEIYHFRPHVARDILRRIYTK